MTFEQIYYNAQIGFLPSAVRQILRGTPSLRAQSLTTLALVAGSLVKMCRSADVFLTPVLTY